jgi:hypothetical protein
LDYVGPLLTPQGRGYADAYDHLLIAIPDDHHHLLITIQDAHHHLFYRVVCIITHTDAGMHSSLQIENTILDHTGLHCTILDHTGLHRIINITLY